LGVSRFSGCCNLDVALLDSALADQELAQIPQSPELGDLVNLHPFYQNGFGLSCASNQRTTVPERIISFAAHPQLVQQHRQLARDRYDGSLLGPLSASFRHLQTPAAQITVDPKGTENVVRSLHQQAPHVAVAFFADVQLRLTLAGVSTSRP
jgi:hypothetical protein